MGRKKIEIQPIKDDRNRQVTFLKRKHGLMKKAYELSVLCNCEVALFIIPPNNKMIQYSSSDINMLINEFQTNDSPKEIKTNEDFIETKHEDHSDNEEQQQTGPMQLMYTGNTMHMVPSQSNMPLYTPHVPSYTMQQPPMVVQHPPMYHPPMYLQQNTPRLYHSPSESSYSQLDMSPDLSPKSEPGTPDKRPKLKVEIPQESHLPPPSCLPSQFAQNLPSPTSYYPEFYQPNFIMSPIQTGLNSVNSFMVSSSGSKFIGRKRSFQSASSK